MYPESNEKALLQQLEVEAAISDLVDIALELWLPLAENAVLQAAAAPPPNPDAVGEPEAQWNYLVDALILYGVSMIVADTVGATYTALTGSVMAAGDVAAAPIPDVDMPGMPTRSRLRQMASRVINRRTRIDTTATEEAIARNPDLRGFVSDYAASARDRIADVVGRAYRRLRGITDETPDAEQAREEARPVFDPLDEQWGNVADEIGRTQATAGLNAAVEYGAGLAGESLGQTIEREWVAILDTHTRAAHAAADGQVRRLGTTFDVGGEQLRWPGDIRGSYENTVNCVVASTLLEWPGQDVYAATRTEHSGTFVDLRTVNGHTLTATSNHPILTDRGYVPAQFLRKGDRVMATRTPGTPLVDDVPSRADEIYGAVRESGIEERVIARGMELHGDASSDQEISIVWTDSGLRHDLDSPALCDTQNVDLSLVHLRQGAVADAGITHRSTRPFQRLIVSRSGPSAGSVGASGQFSASTVVESRHSNTVGFAGGSHVQIEQPQMSEDDRARYVEFSRHTQHAVSLGMHLSELSEVNVYTSTHVVYNLSTSDEWYIGNGIAQHNCRCRTFAYFADIVASAADLPEDDDDDDFAMPEEFNWVDDCGGLPRYIKRIATHLKRKGMTESHAIATAVNAVKKMCATGDVNFPGRQSVNKISRAQACRAVEQWERLKACAARRRAQNSADTAVLAVDDCAECSADHDNTGDDVSYRSFTGVLAVIGEPTDDGRMFADDIALSFRDFPLPLMWCKQSSGGHMDAYTVGVIEYAEVDGSKVVGAGYFLNTAEADEAAEQVEHGVTGPSVDLGDVSWELRDENGNAITTEDEYAELGPDAKLFQTVLSAKVLAATLVSTPAFGSTSLTLGDPVEVGDEALVAAAAVTLPGYKGLPTYNPEFFTDPQFSGPTYPHMTAEGRIQGHLAAWNVCHVGIQDACVLAPHSRIDYAMFHTAPPVRLTNGETAAVGRLTVGGGHADGKLGIGPTIAHYDDAGTCFALVHVGEDEHGIWFSGVPAPGVTPEQLAAGLAAPLSGDWRRHGGNLELVAALSVNTPGFPLLASGATNDLDEPISLVASLGPCKETADGPQLTEDQLRVFARVMVEEMRAESRREAEARALIAAGNRAEARALIAKVGV